MIKKFAIVTLLILLPSVYYFVFDGSLPKISSYKLDLDKIRALADAPNFELPIEIRTEVFAKTPVPYFALRAGGGFQNTFMTRTVFQIMAPSGFYALETGMDLALAEEYNQSENFQPEVWLGIQNVLSNSLAIMVTHEHPDHMGGIVRHRAPSELAEKLFLTMEQFAALDRFATEEGLPSAIRNYQPINLLEPMRVAPGIVIIPAKGHTPGSVIIYVKLQSDKEFLFIGDIAYTASNIRDGVDRARFARLLMHDPEDRDAVVNQLKTLHEISKLEPSLYIIPAHADKLIKHLIHEEVIFKGFILDNLLSFN